MAYVSPYARKQREVENQRAKAASKQLTVLRERANKMAPHSSSASLNKLTNEWNGLTLTNSVFDPTVKKVDIFRLTAGDKDSAATDENGKPNRAEVVGVVKTRNERRKLFAEAIADVLGDQKVANIFHRDSAGRISIPESVENLQATLESARRAQASALLRKQQQQLAQEESEEGEGHIEIESRRASPRAESGLRSPAASSHSHSHSPRVDHWQPASTPVNSRNGGNKSHGPWAVRSPRSVADTTTTTAAAAWREVSTSPMDLSLVGDMAGQLEDGGEDGDGEAFGVDADTYVPVPMYPYSRVGQQQQADAAHMASLVQALNGLVSQMEQQRTGQGLAREAADISAAPRRSLQGAGAVLEDSFIFTGVGVGGGTGAQRRGGQEGDSNELFGNAGERTPAAKLHARQLLSDKVLAHLSREGPATARKQQRRQHPPQPHNRENSQSKGDDAAMTAQVPDGADDAGGPAPHSLGAVRDLILTKLQDVERCHAAAVDLLLHPPHETTAASASSEEADGASAAAVGEVVPLSRTSSSNSARTSTGSGGGSDRRHNKSRSSYQTDAGRLETAVHMHPLAHHAAPAESQATRLPRARAVDVDFHCSHVHTAAAAGEGGSRRQPNASSSDVISFTQRQGSASLRVRQRQQQSSPDADVRRHRQAEAVRSWSAGNVGNVGEEEEGGEVADYERKVAAHFTGALRAPCYSSTHETALRAAHVSTETEGGGAILGEVRGGGKGATKEFGSHSQNAQQQQQQRQQQFHSEDPESFRMQAMREQRRLSMGHLPRLASPASVTQVCQEWKKQMKFARELRDMALESRGISFHYYQDRATDMILDDLVAAVAQEVDAALDEEVARFVTKI